jgi:valyl-tRNA synthetase
VQDFVLGKDEFFIPILDGIVQGEERENITRELEYTNGFLASVEKKLQND